MVVKNLDHETDSFFYLIWKCLGSLTTRFNLDRNSSAGNISLLKSFLDSSSCKNGSYGFAQNFKHAEKNKVSSSYSAL